MGESTAIVQPPVNVELVSLDDNHSVETKVEPDPSSQVPASRLTRTFWPFAFYLPFATGSIAAWVIICLQSSRPLNAAQYNYWQNDNITADQFYDTQFPTYGQFASTFQDNENWYHAARVVQSILAVFTIPLTSAICSYAAVVFAQAPLRTGSLTLRQTMTLADRAWTDPILLARLVRQFRKYGSRFLLFAILLIVNGIIISPLQAIFTTSASVKRATNLTLIASVNDPLSILQVSQQSQNPTLDDNSISLITRQIIGSSFSDTLQGNLWSHGKRSTCLFDSQCSSGAQHNLVNLTNLIDPFYAPIASGTNTGLLTQYLPRMNSSAIYRNITAAQWPANCTDDGAFLVQYYHDGIYNGGTNPTGNWSLVACMPAMQNTSLWRKTRDRQDISEVLYLNISSFSILNPKGDRGETAFIGLYQLTLDTTMGMFQLPNYANGGVPGPLLDTDPLSAGPAPQSFPLQYHSRRRSIDNATIGMSNSTVELETIRNRGPLLTLAMALFGEDSFMYNRFHNPYQYVTGVPSAEEREEWIYNQRLWPTTCVEFLPLLGLMSQAGASDEGMPNSFANLGCTQKTWSISDIQQSTESWLMAFAYLMPRSTIVNAFESAAFLANQVWFDHSTPLVGVYNTSYISLYSDMGQDTEKPYVSFAGKITISVLLGTYLGALFGLCCYAAHKPRWTETLDAFAMMRLGAALSEDLPLRYATARSHLDVLDDSPGCVGDASAEGADHGSLALGAPGPLRARRIMQTYT